MKVAIELNNTFRQQMDLRKITVGAKRHGQMYYKRGRMSGRIKSSRD